MLWKKVEHCKKTSLALPEIEAGSFWGGDSLKNSSLAIHSISKVQIRFAWIK